MHPETKRIKRSFRKAQTNGLLSPLKEWAWVGPGDEWLERKRNPPEKTRTREGTGVTSPRKPRKRKSYELAGNGYMHAGNGMESCEA